jgi:beta-lactamase regulating signal transducer with metallopeptidase domain
MLLLGALLLVGRAGARFAVRFVRTRRAVRALERSARLDEPTGSHVVELEAPVALAVGVLRPRTIVSRGLLLALAPEQVDAVLLHERAHARRRDGLWQPIARAAALAHVPSTRRWLLGELELAAEQACDEEAAAELGDRLTVARAILRVERLLTDAPLRSAVGLRFSGGAIDTRIQGLLAPPPAAFRPGVRGLALAVLAILALTALADPLHHLTETVAGLIAR